MAEPVSKKAKTAVLPRSAVALRTVNPIRGIVDSLTIPKPPAGTEFIPLSIGDPSKFGNLNPPPVFVDALCDAVREGKVNGYQHSAGMETARAAIAARQTRPEAPLTAADVIIASGCSGALEIAIKGLCSEGDNMLMPNPGFALYQTLCESNLVECRAYRLDPERQWECDLAHMESLVDAKTRAILVNNPSNPCGSVYTREHLEAILAVAERHGLPILADEIYGNIVFAGSTFHPMAALTSTVPVLSTGGIAKEFLVPGWRVGWITIHDRNGALAEVRQGLNSLTQLIVGANTLVQAALPRILTPAPGSADATAVAEFGRTTTATLERHAMLFAAEIAKVEGLTPISPQGAMYVMVRMDMAKFPTIKDDLDFCQKLMDEEFVMVLPGACFGIANYFRVVFCAPEPKLVEACTRIARFCGKRAQPQA